MMIKIRKMLKDNKGATAIEYGLIAALIAVAAIGAMTSLGKNLNNTFTTVSSSMKPAGAGTGTGSGGSGGTGTDPASPTS